MDLDQLEKEIIALEADQTLPQTITVLAGIPYLKQDIEFVKAQIDAYINAQENKGKPTGVENEQTI
jgi:hypothetical protein